MTILRTERFKKDFQRLPQEVQQKLGRVLELFTANPRHPSLQVKKMEGAPDIWELRVSESYRVTFQFTGEGILLRRIGTHNVLRRP